MGILNLILTGNTEVSLALSSPKDEAAQNLVTSTSWIDVVNTSVICLAVCICVIAFVLSLRSIILASKKTPETSKPDNKSSESGKEKYSHEKQQFDEAWRYVNMCWKVEHPDPTNSAQLQSNHPLTDEDKIRYKEAWSVVRKYIGAEKDETKQ